MENKDSMSSLTSQSNESKMVNQDSSTTVTHMDTLPDNEPRRAQSASSVEGSQPLSVGDLEALANIQEELDRLADVPASTTEPQEEHGVVGVEEGLTGSQ